MAKERRGFGEWSQERLKPLAGRLLVLTDRWMAANTKANGRPASQTDCARAAGQDDGKWSRWISAASAPDLLALVDVAAFFGVSPAWLLTGDESSESYDSLPSSPADRARLAARALGYAPDVIDSALANPPADADARALFRRILSAENEKMAPAQEPKVLGTRKDVIEAGKLSPDDALAAEEARQKAEAEAKAKAEAKASAAPPPKGKKR